MEGKRFFCAYLGMEVELTPEREGHIIATHPGTLPEYWEEFAATLSNPDQVRRSPRDEAALMFSKCLRRFGRGVIW